MCGIAGVAHSDQPADDVPETVSGMLMNIGHRGPDGLGYVVDDRFALGTVRLAVLDPEAGLQPLSDPSGRYWLCYNGEIYNYLELRRELEGLGGRFQTKCDTEVVLQAWLKWGPDCLPRFNGGFAFALYDRHEQRLVLVRDRFGKRPLFYTQHGGALWFASEMKAFFAVPGFSFEQDPEQLAAIYAQWTPLPDQTGFKGIKNLPLGSWLTFADGRVELNAFSRIDFKTDIHIEDEEEALERIRETVAQSVSLRLRSDVEVGVYLSGGVDSAIVAALAKRFTPHTLATFSVAFEDQEFDESEDQRVIVEQLESRHHVQTIRHRDIVEHCPEAVYHAEIPAFRSAFIPMFLLSKRTREAGIKVILSGEGADEAFLGYDLFKETLLRSAWAALSSEERSARLSQLYPHLSHYGGQDNAAMMGLYQQFSTENMPGLFSHELRFQNGRFSARLIAGGQDIDPFGAIMRLVSGDPDYKAMSAVHKAQWLEYQTLLPGYLLSTQGERMSFAHGVENRCVFLDPAVVELAAATNLKFDDGFREKRLLREAFREIVPSSVVKKRKFPYRAPDAAAFASVRPDYLDLLLSDDELAKMPFLNRTFAKRLTEKVLKTPAGEISTKENQTFLFLLSTAFLHHYFVARNTDAYVPSTAVRPPVQRVVDLRAGAQG